MGAEIRVIFINSPFYHLGKCVTKRVQIGEREVVKTRSTGFFKTEEYVEKEPVYEERQEVVDSGSVSDCRIDGNALATNLKQTIDTLAGEGFEVMSVIPITSGNWNYKTHVGQIWKDVGPALTGHVGHGVEPFAWGYGYGYSFTEGLIVTAVRKSSDPVTQRDILQPPSRISTNPTAQVDAKNLEGNSNDDK